MPAPKIDKRGYDELVEQLKRLAQEKSGWRAPVLGQTDAGLALMQICARYAEQVIERLNRAPEKNFLAFLNLIGARLLPERPAHVPLTFRLATNSPVATVVPAGTQVAAAPQEDEEEQVIFETERELVVTRAKLTAVYAQDHTGATTADDAEALTLFRLTEGTEPALYLGFDQPFEPRPMMLYLQLDPPRPEEVAADRLARSDSAMPPQLRWEYSAREGWKSLAVVDETHTLSRSGLVRFLGPEDFRTQSHFGQTLYWLRLRRHRGNFMLTPRLRQVRINTTWATQVTTIANEILGSGNGNPGQTFYTAQRPVQPGQQVLVREPELPAAAEREALMAAEGADAVIVIEDATGQPDEIWLRWHAVADFYDSGPHDRHYTIDALSGEIRFGDGRYGRVPPPGQNNIRITYRNGGGEQGNRPAETLVQLNSSVPYVDGVSNHEPATGGAAQESIERAKSRGPKALRHRDRAVTAQDLEDLALEASTDVARARAITPRFRPFDLWLDDTTSDIEDQQVADAGRTGVIVVANDSSPRPTPSLNLLRQVREYLQVRCPITTELWVAGPEWIEIVVTVTVVPLTMELADSVGDRVRNALQRFLHPLTGGVHGRGWEFAQKPHRSALFKLLEAVDGVDHVRSLAVAYHPQSADPMHKKHLKNRLERRLNETNERSVPEQELQHWLDRALIYSGEHVITVTW